MPYTAVDTQNAINPVATFDDSFLLIVQLGLGLLSPNPKKGEDCLLDSLKGRGEDPEEDESAGDGEAYVDVHHVLT